MKNLCHYFAGLIAVVLAVSTVHAGDSGVQAIQGTYKAWLEATNDRDITKWSSFLAKDPYFSPADSPPLTNREAVLNYYRKLFSDPEFSLDCEQLEVHVSRSGDMAWSRGACQVTYTMRDGTRGSGSSQWIKVWAKHSDGSWKCRVNSWKIDN